MPLFIGAGIGLVAGVLSGLVGIGGGILIVPALVFAGLSQREASGTSLAALLLPVGILAVMEYGRRHEVRPVYAVGIAVGLTVGALIGAALAGHISGVVLQRMLGVVMMVVAVRLIFFTTA